MKLYICYTYYHALISLIKATKEKIDIILASDIPEYKELGEKMLKTGYIGKVFYCNVKYFKEHNLFKNRFERVLKEKARAIKVFPQTCDVRFEDYEDIYTYNDTNSASRYLIAKGIKYHLIEDALDYFKYFNKYYNLSSASYSKHGWIKLAKSITGHGLIGAGQNKYCIDIEVNDENHIVIPKDKIIVVPRKELFDSLSEEEKKCVFATFAKSQNITYEGKKSLLIFTQPLFKDSFVKTIEDQLSVYEAIVKEYMEKGFTVTIKPHPRDDGNYNDIIEKYNCLLIDKNLPSEILNYDPGFEYEDIVAITTTSINFIQNVRNRIMLGKEYIYRVLEKQNNNV